MADSRSVFLLTVIMFIARQALSVMAPVLRTTFHLSNAAYGRIVSALGFGMMTGEFPVGYPDGSPGRSAGLRCHGGLVVDGYGIVCARHLRRLALGLSQFWKGTGECGAYSGGVKTVTRLFEKKDRTLAIGIFNGGSVIGATLAVPVIVYLLQHYGFRVAFLVPTIAGVSVDTTLVGASTAASLSQRSMPATPAISNRRMLANSSSWAIMLCRFLYRAGDAVLLVLDSELSL